MRLDRSFLFVALFAVSSEGVSFSSARGLFGVRAGGNVDRSLSEEERMDNAVWKAVSAVEEKVQELVSEEVNTLFHDSKSEHEPVVSEITKKAIKKSAENVKKTKAKDHLKNSLKKEEEEPHSHTDHRILHAVEAAETAVLHAIENEVDGLFHDTDHRPDEVEAKAVKKGVEKAKKKVEKHRQDRRDLLQERHELTFEEYSHFIGM